MSEETARLILESFTVYVYALAVGFGVLLVAVIAILGIITRMVPRRSRHRAKPTRSNRS